MNDDKERLAELEYQAWRSGGNPDLVDPDRYDDCRARGYYPEEIGLDHVMPPRRGGDDEQG